MSDAGDNPPPEPQPSNDHGAWDGNSSFGMVIENVRTCSDTSYLEEENAGTEPSSHAVISEALENRKDVSTNEESAPTAFSDGPNGVTGDVSKTSDSSAKETVDKETSKEMPENVSSTHADQAENGDNTRGNLQDSSEEPPPVAEASALASGAKEPESYLDLSPISQSSPRPSAPSDPSTNDPNEPDLTALSSIPEDGTNKDCSDAEQSLPNTKPTDKETEDAVVEEATVLSDSNAGNASDMLPQTPSEAKVNQQAGTVEEAIEVGCNLSEEQSSSLADEPHATDEAMDVEHSIKIAEVRGQFSEKTVEEPDGTIDTVNRCELGETAEETLSTEDSQAQNLANTSQDEESIDIEDMEESNGELAQQEVQKSQADDLIAMMDKGIGKSEKQGAKDSERPVTNRAVPRVEEDSECVEILSDDEQPNGGTENESSNWVSDVGQESRPTLAKESDGTEGIVVIEDESSHLGEATQSGEQEESQEQNENAREPLDTSDVDILTMDDDQELQVTTQKPDRGPSSTSHNDDPDVQILADSIISGTRVESEIITLSPDPESREPNSQHEAQVHQDVPSSSGNESSHRPWSVNDIDIHVMPPSMIKSEPLDDESEYGNSRNYVPLSESHSGATSLNSDVVIKPEPMDPGYGDTVFNSNASSPRLVQMVGSISVVDASTPMMSLYECPECAQQFKWRSSVRKHMNRKGHRGEIQTVQVSAQSSEIQYQCPECDANFLSRDDLRQHMEDENHMSTPFPFSENSQLIGGPHYCKRCSKQFALRSELRQHLRDEHGVQSSSIVKIKAVADSSLQCPTCNMPFKYPSELQRHISRKVCLKKTSPEKRPEQQDWSGPPFKCALCKMVFTYKYNLIKHLQKEHRDANIHYEGDHDRLVDQENPNQPALLRHGDQYVCKVCSLEFMWKQSLKRHMVMKHPVEATIEFPQSPAEIFQSKLVRVQNMSGPPFKCFECPAQFSWKKTLKRHVKTHHGKPVAADTLRHQDYHSTGNTKPQESTAQSHSYRKPQEATTQSHTYLVPESFPCKYCRMRFAWRHSLRRHMIKKHPGLPIILPKTTPSPVNCKYCHMKFSWPSSLRRHLKRKHPNKSFSVSKKLHAAPEMSVHIKTEPGVSTEPIRRADIALPAEQIRRPDIAMSTAHSRPGVGRRSDVAYQCPQCKYIFARKNNCEIHMAKRNHRGVPVPIDISNKDHHSAMGLYQCPVCAKSYFEKAKLKKHFTLTGHRSKGQPAKHAIPMQGTVASSTKGYQNELGNQQSSQELLPIFTSTSTDFTYDSNRHYCKVCKVMLKSKQQHKRHLMGPLHAKRTAKARQNPNVHTCPKCDKGFASVTTLQRHQRLMSHHVAAKQIVYLPQPQPPSIQPLEQKTPAGLYRSQTRQASESEPGSSREFNVGRQCRVCMKKYGDSSKLMRHLLLTQHKAAHIRIRTTEALKKQASRKQAPQAAHEQIRCRVCYREYSTNLKLRKHLSYSNHRTEHDRLSEGKKPYQRTIIPVPPVSIPSYKCYSCGRVYEDDKKLAKHFSNTGHKAEHMQLKEQVEEFAAKHIDITKPIPEDQCLQCGRLAGDKRRLYKHLYNTKHRSEHVRLQGQLPKVPVSTNQSPVKKVVNKSIEEHAGQKCLHCLSVFPDSRTLNQHLLDSQHKEKHNELHYKQIMQAVVSTPKVHVEKLSPEKPPQETFTEANKAESLPKARKSVGMEALETETTTTANAPLGWKIGAKKSKKCLVCGKVCHNRRALRKHLLKTGHRTQHDTMEKGKLSRGPSTPSTPAAQKIVVKTSLFNPGLMKVTCGKCKRRFPTISMLQLHMKKVHGSRMPSMKKTAEENETGSTSAVTEESEESENVQCDICEKQFSKVSSLKKHHFNAHVKPKKRIPRTSFTKTKSIGKGSGSCYLCDMKFLTLTSLKKHVYNAHDVLWSEQDALKFGKEKIEQDASNLAKEGTDQDASKADQDASKLAKEKEEDVCPACGRQCENHTNLKKHYYNAHGVKWAERNAKQNKETPKKTREENCAEDECFQCHLCEKQFNNITPMKQHVFAAHGQFLPPDTAPQKVKPTKSPSGKTVGMFQCELCDKEFVTVTRLKQHTYARHNREAATPSNRFPSAQAVTPDIQQRLKETQPVVRVHKLTVNLDSSYSEHELEDLIRDCEATETKSLYTQLKKHLKNIAQLDTTEDEALDSNQVGTSEDIVQETGEAPSKRQKLESESSQQSPAKSPGDLLKCRVCDLTFNKPASVRRHMKTKKHRWFCSVCHVSYSKITSLRKHEATHPQPLQNQDSAPSLDATDATRYENAATTKAPSSSGKNRFGAGGVLRNIAMDTSDNESEGLPGLPPLDESDDASSTSSYKCNHCSEGFSTRRELSQHKEEKHIIFKCKKCPQRFDSHLELLNHMLMHRSSTPKQHLEESGNSENDVVPIVSEAEGPVLDMSVEEGSPAYDPWTDGEDNATTQKGGRKQQRTSGSKANENETVNVGDGELSCTQCGENFNLASALENHILKYHVSVVPQVSVAPQVHACDICNATFKHKSSLNRHMARGKHRRGSTQTKSSPSQDTDDENSNGSALNDNQGKADDLNSSDVKLYECLECASVFLEERGLVNHIKLGIHTECRVCHKTFADAIELRAHMPRHRTEELMSTENEESTQSENEASATENERHLTADEKEIADEVVATLSRNEDSIVDIEKTHIGLVDGVSPAVATLNRNVETVTENERNRTNQENVVDAEVAAHSQIADSSANRSDCVSPSELLEWIVQAQATGKLGSE